MPQLRSESVLGLGARSDCRSVRRRERTGSGSGRVHRTVPEAIGEDDGVRWRRRHQGWEK